MKDFGDYVELCRAHDTGLDCICISNYTMRPDRTIASRKVHKVVNRNLEEKNVLGRKLGTDGGVDIELTASVAVGLHTYGLDSDKDTPRFYDEIDQEIHMVTTGLFITEKNLQGNMLTDPTSHKLRLKL